MKKNLMIVLLALLSISSCENKSIWNQINEIDYLTECDLFDSAYAKLSIINEQELSNVDQRAHYFLLRIRLGYLTQHPDSTTALDSLVIPHFSQENDQKNLANAYYCKGYGIAIKGDYPHAIYYYKKAEEQAIVVNNDKLLYKVYESLSVVNELTGNYQLDLEYAKKAYNIVSKGKYNKLMPYALYNIALAYARLGQKDSSLYYINKIEPYIKYVQENDLSKTLISIAYLYKHTNPEKAKFYLEKSLSKQVSSYAFSHLADIYLNEGKVDEAYLFWKKAFNTQEKRPKDKILHNILEYDITHGNIDNICGTINEIIAIKDSVIDNLRNDTIKDLQLRFDHEVAMRKQDKITSNWQRGLLAAAFLILLLITYIIIKRNREKAKMQETQLEIDDLMEQIRELEEFGAHDSAAIKKLNDQIKSLMDKEGVRLKQGKMLYDQIAGGGTVHEWQKKDFELYVNYFKAIHYKTVSRLERVKRNEKLTPHKLFFLILNEMGYEKKEIARILAIEESSVNTLYFRTKPIE